MAVSTFKSKCCFRRAPHLAELGAGRKSRRPACQAISQPHPKIDTRNIAGQWKISLAARAEPELHLTLCASDLPTRDGASLRHRICHRPSEHVCLATPCTPAACKASRQLPVNWGRAIHKSGRSGKGRSGLFIAIFNDGILLRLAAVGFALGNGMEMILGFLSFPNPCLLSILLRWLLSLSPYSRTQERKTERAGRIQAWHRVRRGCKDQCCMSESITLTSIWID